MVLYNNWNSINDIQLSEVRIIYSNFYGSYLNLVFSRFLITTNNEKPSCLYAPASLSGFSQRYMNYYSKASIMLEKPTDESERAGWSKRTQNCETVNVKCKYFRDWRPRQNITAMKKKLLPSKHKAVSHNSLQANDHRRSTPDHGISISMTEFGLPLESTVEYKNSKFS